MKFEGVIFDLDGTLLDTIDDISDSMNLVLKKRGFKIHTVEFYKSAVGAGTEKLVIDSLPENVRDEKTIKECLKELKENYSRMWANKTKPYPGIKKLLKDLNQKKIPLSVLSNKDDRFTKEIVKHFFPDVKFEFVFGSREGVPKKPSPEVPLYIAEKTDIPPHKYIFVGDSAFDMLTAKNAGMLPVGVSWGFKNVESLIESGAGYILKEPSELLNFFRK